MRIRNKELRTKRHRKEQIIKEAIRVAKAAASGGVKKEKKVAAPKPAAAKKAPKKAEKAPAAE
ncbi:MAG TPA: hypothetical protein VK171_00475 [Fimbriimonas sp.]|nr:hypothetical protein [Fimbriimonas sp.]